MNIMAFTGNLGDSARVNEKQTLADFPVAVRSGWGEHEKTSWVRCKILGKRAASKLPDLLTKGTKVAVTGELVVETYEKRDGTKGTNVVCLVRDIDVLSEKPKQEPKREPEEEEEIPF